MSLSVIILCAMVVVVIGNVALFVYDQRKQDEEANIRDLTRSGISLYKC